MLFKIIFFPVLFLVLTLGIISVRLVGRHMLENFKYILIGMFAERGIVRDNIETSI